MRKVIALAVAVILIVGCKSEVAQKTTPEAQQTTQQSETNKKVIIPEKEYALLLVESLSCIYCKQLRKDIATEENLQKALETIDFFSILYESYTPVKSNFGGEIIEMSERDLVRKLKALSFPNLIFYNREGNIILQIPGYLKPQQLICVIDYVRLGAYKQEDVNSYLKKNKCA